MTQSRPWHSVWEMLLKHPLPRRVWVTTESGCHCGAVEQAQEGVWESTHGLIFLNHLTGLVVQVGGAQTLIIFVFSKADFLKINYAVDGHDTQQTEFLVLLFLLPQGPLPIPHPAPAEPLSGGCPAKQPITCSLTIMFYYSFQKMTSHSAHSCL